MTEKELLQAVRDIATQTGWLDGGYHTHNSRRSTPGFPDLVLVRPPRIIFAELKSDRGQVTQAQSEWLTELGRCPSVETYLWRPADLEQIGTILSSRYRAGFTVGTGPELWEDIMGAPT